MRTCTRKIAFDSGHRVMNHESKCANLHGHRYVVEITARAANLDEIGRVIDFSVLKERVGGWIDKHWDHRFLLFDDDPTLRDYAGEKIGIVRVPFNPTAENMAQYICTKVSPAVLESTGVEVCHVRVHETTNCYADYSLEDG